MPPPDGTITTILPTHPTSGTTGIRPMSSAFQKSAPLHHCFTTATSHRATTASSRRLVGMVTF
ncbi:MAG: hypothetical protein ABR543_10945 [Gemmatimonadaceae bacterium]